MTISICLARQAAGSVDLVYIDPPFRTGRTRSARPGQHSSYADSWPRTIGGYLDFLRPRLEHDHRVLRLSGTIYVHLDWRSVHPVRQLLDDPFGARNFLNEMDQINQMSQRDRSTSMSGHLPSGHAIIQQQLTELDALARQTIQDLNTVAGTERVAKWKARTVALLTEAVGQAEGQRFSAIQPGPSFTHDMVEEFTDLIDCYRTPLAALARRLAEVPGPLSQD